MYWKQKKHQRNNEEKRQSGSTPRKQSTVPCRSDIRAWERAGDWMEIEYVLKKEDTTVKDAIVCKGHTVMKVPTTFIAGDLKTTLRPYDDFKPPEGDGYFRLSMWECGGADKVEGFAEIICGSDGEKLKPARIDRKAKNVNTQHALFVGNCFVCVKTEQVKSNFQLSVIEYIIDPDTGITTAITVWTGKVGHIKDPDETKMEELPEQIQPLYDAIVASLKKALHYNCKEPYYFIDKE